MNDMSSVIVPRSDQVNADSLLAGPRVVSILGVDIRPGTEQPVSIKIDDTDGKVWRPCKSMSRVLVAAWGPDAKLYVGRSVKLFCDPNVTWGGMKVGGIRISHMSHIEREMVIALTATKGKKVMATIKPLVVEQLEDAAAKWAGDHVSALGQVEDLDGLNAHIAAGEKAVAKLKTNRPELHAKVTAAYDVRRDMLTPTEGRADTEMGEGFTADPEAGEDPF